MNWSAAQWRVKRVLEWMLALVLLLLLLPVLALIAIAIKCDSEGPILFVQERLGRGGRTFRMYKFRSLRWEPGAASLLNPDGSTRVDPDDVRLTRLGRFLRRGWDELPQLFNVLRGDMALIGPRPDEPFHRKYYSPEEEQKLTVLPGITGLPQASGRNEIPWKERIQMDLYYINRHSLWLDVKIAVRTVGLLIRRKGAQLDLSREIQAK